MELYIQVLKPAESEDTEGKPPLQKLKQHPVPSSELKEEKKNKRGTGDQAAAAYPSLAALTLVAGANLFGPQWWRPI